ncbi:globin domain-containing protein [Corynebacterium bovis]|uniref:nitric oxide dioxygenase n=1 Tax=Corynebacterium bovis TaxID=36808 RepID=A0A426Q095_9CORY|nr:globin domain-containing protein [Corynebacterium bovis]MDN8579345.1 globin domain-containing protein [Corynebacterium bovis]RRO87433.1 hemin transporter [Corynebacterium bovis]RRO90553.1 hemin transporter [Corynebacterium bovis]
MLTTTHPRLTPEHERTVRETLPLVGAHIGEITRLFYRSMFAAHPELGRDLFNRGNQRSGGQQKALAASVATFATMLVDPGARPPEGMLSRIAHKHVSLGVTAEQYVVVHDHLFAAIGEVLGDAVTPEVAEAWEEVYRLLEEVLVGEERALYRRSGVDDGDVFVTARLRGSRVLTPRVTELTFDAPGFADTRPGQYTSIGVRLPDGARQLRQYSLVDWDGRGFTVVVQRDGEVSSHLLDTLPATVDATLPAGDLVLAGDEPLVLVGSGIGSTPLVGILRGVRDRPVTVLHVEQPGVGYAQEEVTDRLVAALGGEHRRFTGEVELADLPEGARWYLCGGERFLRAVLPQVGRFAPAAVHTELFTPNDWLV